MKHRCLATGCKKTLEVRFLMCAAHWRLVPSDVQREVYAAYTPGQTVATASEAWNQAVARAVRAVTDATKGGEL